MATQAPPNWYGTKQGINWDALPVQERAVQWAAWAADVEHIKEQGHNTGFWVKKFLAYVGLGGGYAWCAAFDSWVLGQAGWSKFKSASVAKWRTWSETHAVAHSVPRRGDLAICRKNGISHIEIVIAVPGDMFEGRTLKAGEVGTIGANTSSGVRGSQQDGDGVYRRIRPIAFFTEFSRWWEA